MKDALDVTTRLQLVEKYTELARRYANLVKRLSSPGRTKTALLPLIGAWTMHGFTAGVALVRDGKLLVANADWWKLHSRAAAFTVEDKQEKIYNRLYDLVDSLLPNDETSFARSLRVNDSDSQRVLDVRIESRTLKGRRVTLVLASDVTAQVNAERHLIRLREAGQQRDRLRAIGQVAAGMAHDLESTLQGVLLRVSLLERDPDVTVKQTQHLKHLRFGIESAAAAVGQIRRLGARQGETAEPVALKQILEEAIELVGLQFARRPEGKAILIEKSIWPMPPVMVRKSEVFHLFVNLLLNARDAMAEGGRVRVGARTTDFGARITIADQGPGFSDEMVARAFDPFMTNKGARGTGLGLSLAHATMSELGGRISLHNRAARGGAVIALDFPRASKARRPKTGGARRRKKSARKPSSD